MPTIKQLPIATSVQASDLLPVSQGGVTRGLSVGSLLSSVQAAITLVPGKLLGRVSAAAGGPEPIDVGTGLAVSAGAVVATGADHLTLPLVAELSDGDEVIVNAGGAAKRLPYSGLGLALTGSLGPAAFAGVGTTPGTVADGGALAVTSAAVARAITIGGAPVIGPQTVALLMATGNSQPESAALSAPVNIVSSVAGGAGVMLPAQARTTVVNRGSGTVNVYPPPGGRIEAGAVNGAAQVPPGGAATFVTADNATYYAV